MLDHRKSFARNLRYLYDRHRSVAEVCRQLDINRQQFNKYLSGASFPSAHNLARICTFFGVEETMLHLPPPQFTQLLQSDTGFGCFDVDLEAADGDAERDGHQVNDELSRYLGLYHTYNETRSADGKILRALAHIYRLGGKTLSKYFERWPSMRKSRRSYTVYRMVGTVKFLSSNIYILDRRTGLHPSYALTVLYPCRREPVDMIHGLTLSVGVSSENPIYSSKIAYVHLGSRISMKQALKGCGVYPPDAPEVPIQVRRVLEIESRL